MLILLAAPEVLIATCIATRIKLGFEGLDVLRRALVFPANPREQEVKYVLSNAFGVGGTNSCVAYKKV